MFKRKLINKLNGIIDGLKYEKDCLINQIDNLKDQNTKLKTENEELKKYKNVELYSSATKKSVQTKSPKKASTIKTNKKK